jgi:hypothetical protein
MKPRYIYLAYATLASLFCSPAYSLCDSGTGWVYATAYAIRSGGQMVTFANAYATGPDSEYDTITITQNDTLNGVALGTPLTNTAPPNLEATTRRTSDIATTGYGVYQTQGHVSMHDSCSGANFPPFSAGTINGDTNIASATVIQPTISGVTQIYNQTYIGSNPNGGSVPTYNNTGQWVAYFPGATGTPQWTFSGDTSGVSGICTSCTGMNITASINSTPGCSAAFTATFTVDGLTSTPQGMAILAPMLLNITNPATDQHVDHLPQPGGYISYWHFQNVDSCENPMQYVNNSEVFPAGFTCRYFGSNWPFPTANPWSSGPFGAFDDKIGEAFVSGGIPTPLAPLQPVLGNIDVYDGAQQFFVYPAAMGTPWLIWSGTQTHYQDHGGHQ